MGRMGDNPPKLELKLGDNARVKIIEDCCNRPFGTFTIYVSGFIDCRQWSNQITTKDDTVEAFIKCLTEIVENSKEFITKNIAYKSGNGSPPSGLCDNFV